MGVSGVQAAGRQKTSLRVQCPVSFKGRQEFPWWTAFLCVNEGAWTLILCGVVERRVMLESDRSACQTWTSWFF